MILGFSTLKRRSMTKRLAAQAATSTAVPVKSWRTGMVPGELLLGRDRDTGTCCSPCPDVRSSAPNGPLAPVAACLLSRSNGHEVGVFGRSLLTHFGSHVLPVTASRANRGYSTSAMFFNNDISPMPNHFSSVCSSQTLVGLPPCQLVTA